MKCTLCGGPLHEVRRDLPFKVGDTSIVIIKNLPVFQCASCPEYLIGDAARPTAMGAARNPRWSSALFAQKRPSGCGTRTANPWKSAGAG
ncbi:YgiT-type zinc finger protein [Desulfosoma sp.]